MADKRSDISTTHPFSGDYQVVLPRALLEGTEFTEGSIQLCLRVLSELCGEILVAAGLTRESHPYPNIPFIVLILSN